MRCENYEHILILLLIACLSGCASFAPDSHSDETNPVLYPLHFFRSHISGADGARCPMYPTCSTYGLEAFRKHGSLMGWIMTSDRLMRCGRDEVKTCPPIRINGEKHCYDSVNNNDFWW